MVVCVGMDERLCMSSGHVTREELEGARVNTDSAIRDVQIDVGIGDLDAAHNLAGVDVGDASGFVSLSMDLNG
ncbi:hypothetical protein BDN67DRAFT_1073022 [Paxillus ammoniavirescens]|nr:hypothetical protein BDN67DRAFT_1073022 [Paxillus ammoniavirescens]